MPTPNSTPLIDSQFKALLIQDHTILDKFLARIAAGDSVTTAKHTSLAKYMTPALTSDKAQYVASGGA